jgi:hypothetical protein
MGATRGLYARPVPSGKFPFEKPTGGKSGPERQRRMTVCFSEKQSGSRTMPRYFFHVRDRNGDISRDEEGQDLPDLEAARAEAVNANREMLGERLLHGGSLNHRQIEIADETGKILIVIPASDVMLRDGEWLSYSDDVTKSAPSGPSRSTETKPPSQ